MGDIQAKVYSRDTEDRVLCRPRLTEIYLGHIRDYIVKFIWNNYFLIRKTYFGVRVN